MRKITNLFNPKLKRLLLFSLFLISFVQLNILVGQEVSNDDMVNFYDLEKFQVIDYLDSENDRGGITTQQFVIIEK